jgi:small subunit ribosomal protein S6
MNYYEILYIVSPALSEAEREELIKKLNAFIEEKGGEVVSENRWGTRTLAYPIKKHTSGYYVLTYIKLPPENLSEVKYFMRINEGFLREMILKKKEVPVQKKSANKSESATKEAAPEPKEEASTEKES